MKLLKLLSKNVEQKNINDRGQIESDLGDSLIADENKQSEAPITNESNSLTISYATGWPIDIVYGYLRKNYEEQGFNDAMIKSDLAFRDMNMAIIRNRILIVFREINLRYDVMKHDLETKMTACSSAGLLSTVSELDNSMTIIDTHKEELRTLEMDFRNATNEASIPLQSYECGFLRGIATISMGITPIANIPTLLK